MNLLTPLRRAVTIGPERPAVVGDWGTRTYAELADRIGRLGHALADPLDTGPGDRVAIVAANCPQYLEIYQGVPGFGRVLVPLNARHTMAELEYALRDAGATVLFTDLDPVPFKAIVPRRTMTALVRVCRRIALAGVVVRSHAMSSSGSVRPMCPPTSNRSLSRMFGPRSR